MCSVGRLRSLHADCRPVGTTRANWGRPSGLWRPSNGQPTWPSHPCCALVWGRHGGDWTGVTRLHTMPDGCCMVPRGCPASSPSSCIHSSSQPPNAPLSPLQFVLVLARTNRIGPAHTYFCPPSPAARRRQPADLVTVHLGPLPPAHAFSQSCFLALFPSFFLNLPPESIIPVHQRPSSLSRASERATSINYRASSCCIYVIEPAGHQVPCSHLMGGVLPEIVSCIIDLFSSLLSPTSPGSPDQRTMVGGLIRFLIPFNVRRRPKSTRQSLGSGGAGYGSWKMEIVVLIFFCNLNFDWCHGQLGKEVAKHGKRFRQCRAFFLLPSSDGYDITVH